MAVAATADPTQNPLNQQAFWNEFMRRPEAKAAYQAEKKLQMKKQAWLEERRAIEDRGARRKLIAAALEEAPAEVKKLIAPIFHLRVVEQFLWMIYDECGSTGLNFIEKLRDERTSSYLRKLRENFQDGGEDRIQGIEDHWYSLCNGIAEDQEKQKLKDQQPITIDVHTLKDVLEFGQECKREGNNKFREGLYEEAMLIYTQGDDVMKRYQVPKHLTNERQWLKDYHLACLKNKAQAAIKLDLFQTALEAAEAALVLDAEDHKAWYRKALAQKSLGKFHAAEESLSRLEDIAQRGFVDRQVLKDCVAERQRIRAARTKHKLSVREMIGKAFEDGVFSVDRELDLQDTPEKLPGYTEAQAEVEAELTRRKKQLGDQRPLDRHVQLTAALAGDLLDELAEAYDQGWFQERVQKCARDSNFDRTVFLMRLKTIAIEVQRPVLEKWGFEGGDRGIREMTAAIRDYAGRGSGEMPDWLKSKQRRCLEALYGGREFGMANLLVT